MKIAVMCAMREEIELLRGKMDGATSREVAGVSVTNGTLAGHELMLCVGMIGKTNIAAGTQMAICTFAPDLLVNVGLAGNCTDSLSLGSAVVADKLLFHDFSMSIASENAPYTEFYTPTARYIELAERLLGDMSIPFVRGTVATGDQFVSDEAVKRDIIERTGCSAVEMEGAAFACIAQKNGVDYLSVKILSDNASDDGYDAFTETMSAGAYCDTSTGLIINLCKAL